MENTKKLERFSSCRGVTFEIKPHLSPFAITNAPKAAIPTSKSKRNILFHWGSSSKIFPSFNVIRRTSSRPSSHFCDIEPDEVEEDNEEYSIGSIKSMEDGHRQEELKVVPNSELPRVQSEKHRSFGSRNHRDLFSVIEATQATTGSHRGQPPHSLWSANQVFFGPTVVSIKSYDLSIPPCLCSL
ncbi:hypothetical protein RHGRI_037679 [Rhododendron griersonianum]|uniref:Ovate family protein n=1 Tax=Rhododendron griersonianum TaxID=479676 RepID=A0AAV6HSN8_9ERIC|nr:hypothetical protein RHGRI_037679 [Rhododendron griersonianum]